MMGERLEAHVFQGRGSSRAIMAFCMTPPLRPTLVMPSDLAALPAMPASASAKLR